MALAPPKSGLFVNLPRDGQSSTPSPGGGGSVPIPVYSSAVLTLVIGLGPVSQHQAVARSSATLGLSIALSGNADATPALPDPGIGNALLVDTLGNYLVDTNGDYLYGKEP